MSYKQKLFYNLKLLLLKKYSFFKLGFSPWKAEQLLWGIELQENETQKS